jgi:hypothetical protein
MRTGAVTVIALFSAAAVLTVAAAAGPRWRRQLPKVIGLAAGGVLAAFLVGRGAVEFFIVHYGDPASYRNALPVHGGPARCGRRSAGQAGCLNRTIERWAAPLRGM